MAPLYNQKVFYTKVLVVILACCHFTTIKNCIIQVPKIYIYIYIHFDDLSPAVLKFHESGSRSH